MGENDILDLEEEIHIPEDDKKSNERIKELASKTDASDEEKAELAELKKKRTKTVTDKIKKFYTAKTDAEKRAEAAEERARVAEEKARQLEEGAPLKKPALSLENQVIKIGGKTFYTDEALEMMIENKEIDYRQAQKHIQERIKEEAVSEAELRLEKKYRKETAEDIKKKDFDSVLKEFPQFAKGHADFNPDDSLYKETVRIYNNGYAYHPSGMGLSEALKEAKRNLKISDKKPDMSDEFNVDGSTFSGPGKNPEDKIVLTDFEKTTAIRQFHYGGLINPVTGKVYTEQEAVAKSLKAKQRRFQETRR